ncbi:hypothetical protein BH11PLA1_BH11PLA1_19480 [soil metagenome]
MKRAPRQTAQEIDAAEETAAALIGKAISSIKPTDRDPGTVLIRVRGKRAGLLPAAALDALGVAIGGDWTQAVRDAAATHGLRSAAREDALRLLTRAAQSKAGLAQKLQRKGHARALSVEIAEELEAKRLINDELLAHNFVQSRLIGRRTGKNLLFISLIKRGVTREVASATLAELLPATSPIEDATRLARQRLARIKPGLEPQAVKRRVLGMLARRGYEFGVCLDAFKAAQKSP